LVVTLHGGPTAAAIPEYTLKRTFWTSRGFAVLDVNYAGSTGFGRAYRQRLDGAWGVAEVADVAAGARHLAAEGRVDGTRAVITGGSAGGFTTLAALAFTDVFAAGASHFGVGDLAALARDTHKLESRYLWRLVAPWPEGKDVYEERSPLRHVDRISAPLILLQGTDDRVVPPAQAEEMAAAVRGKGLPMALVMFESEGHGFRALENQARALECELSFYAQVFGFDLPDQFPPVVIENLRAP
jgi:dipeptidyl aminopeptidase/acylaminoacyl peptidase